jgi:hypothetical protein
VEEQNRLFPIEGSAAAEVPIHCLILETAADGGHVQMGDAPQIIDWESFVTKLRQQFVHMDSKWLA